VEWHLKATPRPRLGENRSFDAPLSEIEEYSPAPVRRGAKAYYAAAALSQVFALARYTVLARLIGPEQLGFAATIILTAQFFEMVADSGSDRFLVQNRDGDEPRVQRLVHSILIVRGVITAAILILFAYPLAQLFGSPVLAAGFAILAVSPLIAGFVHMDVRRAQRHHDFRSEAACLVVSEGLSLVVTVAAALWLRDYTAILYGLITRSLAFVVVSHLMAERRYGVGLAAEHSRPLARFALPLMLNGLLLFLGSQGDRILIANQLGMRELGHYSAALLLIASPIGVLTRALMTMHMPLISAQRDNPAAMERAGGVLRGQSLLLAIGSAVGFALVAPWMVIILFGRDFAQPAVVLALVGILSMVRFVRLWPTTIALANGRSEIPLIANIVRLSSLPAAVLAIFLMSNLAGIVVGFIFGEIAACITGMVLTNRATGRPLRSDFGRLSEFLAACALIIAWPLAVQHHSLAGAGVLAVLTAAVGFWVVRQEAPTLRDTLEKGMRLARVVKIPNRRQ
jgi:O-antigen/teichoic acid export membrane protein